MRPSWPALAALLLGGALSLAFDLSRSDREVNWWAWSVAGVLTVVSIILNLRWTWQANRVRSADDDIENVVESLAAAVHAQWRRELGRRLPSPPLRLPWRLMPPRAGDGSRAAVGASRSEWIFALGTNAGPEDLVDMYQRSRPGRLAIVGGPGSGKSVLAAQFVAELVRTRGESDPVPVLFPIASWEAVHQTLDDWLTDQLIKDHPFLAANRPRGGTLARALIDAGRIIPVLDGFDELPANLRNVAARRLASAALQVVLTSRSGEYRAAMGVLLVTAPMTLVELLPLRTVDVRQWLREASPAGDARWDGVLEELARNPEGPLAGALSAPFAANLLLRVYSDDLAAPGELLDRVRFGDQQAIVTHLLEAFVPSIYRDEPANRRSREMRWLGALSRQLQNTGALELAWWQLHRTVPVTVFLGVALVAGLVGGVAAELVFDALGGPIVGAAFGSVSTMLIALVLSLATRSGAPPYPARIRLRTGRSAQWLVVGAVAGVGGVLVKGWLQPSGGSSWTEWANWIMVGVGVGLVVALRDAVNVSSDASTAVTPIRLLRQDRTLALAQGANSGLTAILVVTLAGGLSRSPVASGVLGAACALAGAASTAYYRYLVSLVWLAARGRSPWLLMSFLDDARRRGALRQVGGSYQFRHALLQEHLAAGSDDDFGRRPVDAQAVRAISQSAEWLVNKALERADVWGVVERPRLEALRREIRAEIESTRTTIAGTTTVARQRFVAAKARYVEQAAAPVLSRAATAYRLVATALAEFAGISFLMFVNPDLGNTVLLVLLGAVLFAALIMLIPGLVSSLEALLAPAVREAADRPDDPDDEATDEPANADRPPAAEDAEPGRWLARVVSVLPRAEGRWLAASRFAAECFVTTMLALVGVVALVDRDLEFFARNPDPTSIAVIGAVAFGLLWLWSRPGRARWLALRSEDPADWPTDRRRAAAARRDAVQARTEWLTAVLENGVLPLVSARVEVLSRRSYDTVLPAASMAKLGDITESAQFVPTETSAQLSRMLNAMASGAIGLSGPRGIGKSTVLQMFGDRRFGARTDDVTLVVHAPTNYNSRDFLVHLFTRVCELVLLLDPGAAPAALVSSARSGRRGGQRVRRPVWWLLLACLGVLAVLGAVGWSSVVLASGWLRDHVRTTVATAGVLMIAAAVAMLVRPVAGIRRRRTRRWDASVEELARHHLRTLRYLETATLARTGALKVPTGVEFGGSTSRQRAEQVRTYPELVNDFREFLGFLGLRLRSRTDRAGSRVVICIDEVDKIATAEQAERFINDIKTVFGVEGCFFLVAVSEDALASFARRALAVRTTFDSAFDNVIQVRRFLLADTRRLLVQRVLRLPEPYVWLCHSLSGGLPRDLNRTVRSMFDIRMAHGTDELSQIAAELIRQDLETVAHGQLLRVSGRVDPYSGSVLRWLAGARHLPLRADDLTRHSQEAPQAMGLQRATEGLDIDEPQLLTEQFRAYLLYAAALVTCFCEQAPSMIERLSGVADDQAHPVQRLADARAYLSIDPAMAMAEVDAFRAGPAQE